MVGLCDVRENLGESCFRSRVCRVVHFRVSEAAVEMCECLVVVGSVWWVLGRAVEKMR